MQLVSELPDLKVSTGMCTMIYKPSSYLPPYNCTLKICLSLAETSRSSRVSGKFLGRDQRFLGQIFTGTTNVFLPVFQQVLS
ncbi:hypothetical protein DFR87_13115 [Metallosphaera hakonensis JCM 8857 = DSM 7519]|nr:hypothetical protein DFR87_13115 [Metallosphaera hakonensis JCM 8857 = DSM 7519]